MDVFNDFLTIMKRTNLFYFCILLTALFPSEALAGSINGIRKIHENNIYQCSTNRSWERVDGAGNMNFTDAQFTMGCLNVDNTARWVMQSSFTAQTNYGPSNMLSRYIPEPNIQGDVVIYTKRLPKTLVGVNCQRQSETWKCENIKYYESLTVTTYGGTLLDPLGIYYQQHQSFPGINLPFTAANSEQRRLLNQAKNCYGTRDYCSN